MNVRLAWGLVSLLSKVVGFLICGFSSLFRVEFLNFSLLAGVIMLRKVSPPRESVEINRRQEVGEQESYNVEPHPECEGRNESQGYNYILEVHDQLFTGIHELDGHRRAVWVPH